MLIKCSTSLVRSIRPKGCLVVVVSSLFRATPSQNALFRTCALGNPSIDEQVYVHWGGGSRLVSIRYSTEGAYHL